MSDIPEWFITQATREHDLSISNIIGDPVPFCDTYLLGLKHAFKILSKPENLAKIPEVKTLIGAVKHANETGFSFDDILKPFEGDTHE